MATLAEIRQQYPQYQDVPDAELADKLYSKFYSDMPRADFDRKLGLVKPRVDLGEPRQPERAYPRLPADMSFGEMLGETWPGRIVKSIWSGATLPGDVYAGKVDPLSDEAIGRSAELATVPAMGVTGALPRGALGVGAALARQNAKAPISDLVRASQRLGVDLPKAAASDKMLTQRVGQVVSNIPIGGGPLRKASEKAVSQLGDAAEGVASTFGKGKAFTPAEAGDTTRLALERYIGPTTKARVTKAYDAVDELVDKSVTSPLNRTATVAAGILSRRKEAALKGPGGAVELIAEAAGRPAGLTYEGIKLLRTRVGEMLDNSILPADISQAELKQIYGALTEDLKTAVGKAGGSKALSAFERANRYNMLVQQRRENLMRLLGAKNDEGVFDRLVRSAGSKSSADLNLLLQARKAIPADEWDDIMSGVVARLGRGQTSFEKAGQTMNATGVPGEFSAERFLTAYSNLSPGGRNILFKSTGAGGSGLADALDDIALVSTRFKELNRFANPSGTGQAMIGGSQVISGGGAVLGAVDPVTFAASIIGPNLIARALSRPATARALAGWGRVYNGHAVSPTRVSSQALAFASRRLATELAADAGLTAAQVSQIVSGLQGGDQPAAAGQ